MKNTIKFIAITTMITWACGTFAAEMGAKGHAHGHGIDALGKPGVATQVTRTIAIDMADSMRFTPDKVEVKQGETIRFVVKNSGKLKHEFNLGTDKDLKAHAEVMKKFPEMEHDEPNIASVAPGGTGEVIWQFTKAGSISFACLHPGHYDAGMKGSLRVVAATLTDMATGEVKKIDKALQKITLKHGEIKSLDMPGMTMVFKVVNAQLLEKVKVGDTVQFNAEQRAGAIVVTTLQVAP
jgi:uncharacterized cupredoxin-like copper-binding protein